MQRDIHGPLISGRRSRAAPAAGTLAAPPATTLTAATPARRPTAAVTAAATVRTAPALPLPAAPALTQNHPPAAVVLTKAHPGRGRRRSRRNGLHCDLRVEFQAFRHTIPGLRPITLPIKNM